MIALASVVALLALAPPALPSDSLYLVEDRFEDQRGHALQLAAFRGQPVLLAMFYARCPQACPLLITDVKRVLAGLPALERSLVKVVLVTLDPERDTAVFLQETLTARALDDGQWTLLRTDPAATRTLAAVLGVRYREGAGGAIDHTSQIALLDRAGRKVAVRAEIGAPVQGFAAAVVDVIKRP
jgi:protein SCO1/2